MMSGYVAASSVDDSADSDQIQDSSFVKQRNAAQLEKNDSEPSLQSRAPSHAALSKSASVDSEFPSRTRPSSPKNDTDEPKMIFFKSELSDTEILSAPERGVIKRRLSLQIEDPDITRRPRSLSVKAQQTDVEKLAKEIFSAWDLTGDGVLTAEEIVECSGLDQEFARSLVRVLSFSGAPESPGSPRKEKSEIITEKTLSICLEVLMNGELEDKVMLLFKFMDISMSGTIDYDEVKRYISMVGEKGLEKLGFLDEEGAKKSVKYEDLLALFENSVRGDAAILIFCQQVTNLLTSKRAVGAPGRFIRRVASIGEMVGPDGVVSCSSCSTNLWKSVREYVDNHTSKESLFMYGLSLLQVMFWLINFFYYWNKGMPKEFCIAKGFGLNLRVITLALFFSMMRRTMGAAYGFSFLRPFIPMGFNIQIHSFLGFSCLFHSFGHMFGHIAFHEMHTPGFKYLFTQDSLINNSGWSKRGKGDAITGYILIFFICIMAITALYRGKGSKYYRFFFLTHYLYNLWPVFIFLHVPDLWPYFVSIFGLFILERAYDFYYMTIFSTLDSSRAGSNGVTFLSVPRKRDTYPGSYYRIKVPAISNTEWHPFSLASGVSSHHLTFFVASSGDWTKQLYKIVSDEQKRKKTIVQVQGPFYAPAKTATKFSTHVTLLVASGIGITPFFSVMATKVADELNYQNDKSIYNALFKEELQHRGGSLSTSNIMRNMRFSAKKVESTDMQDLRVVWMMRDCSELLFYIDYVYELVKSQDSLDRPVVFVDVYLTGLGKISDPVHMISQTLFMLTVSDKTSKYMTVHFGRPDMPKIFKGTKPDHVYYCGGALMQNILTKICREVGAKFHPEDFDAGTSFVSNIEKVFKSRQVVAAREKHKTVVMKRRMSVTGESGKHTPGPNILLNPHLSPQFSPQSNAQHTGFEGNNDGAVSTAQNIELTGVTTRGVEPILDV